MPEVRIDLGDAWVREGATFARGHGFLDGDLHDASDLAGTIDSPADLESAASGAHGLFAIVHHAADVLAAAVDHVRSVPLYYARSGGTFHLSDDPRSIRDAMDEVTYDPVSEAELVIGNLVSGENTLFREIDQMQAGEYLELRLRPDQLTTDCYLTTPVEGVADVVGRPRAEDYRRALRDAFDRLVAFADGRQIAIALSGGVDSRLVATALADAGYEDLLAFSYGKPDHADVTTARRVARALDVPWASVEYSQQRWYDWYHSEDRVDYYRSAFDYGSAPILSAVPALRELDRSGPLAEDAVIVTGDSIVSASEHIPWTFLRGDRVDRSAVLDTILRYQYGYWEGTDRVRSSIRDRLADQVHPTRGTADAAARAIETWDWRERQAKLICSPDEFEVCGHRYYPPLFDRAVMRFWRGLPLESRAGKAYHVSFVDDWYESVTGDDGFRRARAPGLGERLTDLVRRSPFRSVAAGLHRRSQEHPVVYKHLKDGYRSDPLGQFGFVPEDQFYELYTGSQNYHSFVVLELVGRVSYDPPALECPPVNGRVDLRSEEPDAIRTLPWF